MRKWNSRWIPNQRSYRHDNRGGRFQSGLPPPYAAVSKANSVPEWEKKFCYEVGLIPWRKVLDAKLYASCYSDVMKWDDSEAKDTFHSAKRRFYRQMNGLCIDDAPLPDPDTYIDQIDWNVNDDSDLYNNLDDAFLPVDASTEGKEQVSSAGVVDISVLFQNSQWQDHGTTWENGGEWDAGVWKPENEGWGAVNDIQGGAAIVEGTADQWNNGPNKCSDHVDNNAWGQCNDNSRGWRQPEQFYATANPHRAAAKNNGWAMPKINSWGRNHPPNHFKETKVWVTNSSQHKGAAATRECGKYGDQSQFRHSWNNNLHTNDTYYISRENQQWGNIGDRKRESPNNYTPRSKSHRFHRMDNQRHDQHQADQPWRNRQSMHQAGSSYRPS